MPPLVPPPLPTRCLYLLAKLSIASIVDYFASDTSADVRAQSGPAPCSPARASPFPLRPPPCFQGLSTYARRCPIVLDGVCTLVYYGSVCVHQPRTNQTRSCSQGRTASGREGASFALFLPLSATFRRESFLGQLRPLFDNVPSACRRAIEFLACFTPAPLSQIRSIDLSQYRAARF